MHPLVVHNRKAKYDVLIDRTTKWGNPFSDNSHSTALWLVKDRAEAVARYREWLMKKPELLAAVRAELKGKVLGCWCAPLLCHGEVLASVANEGTDI